MCVIASVVALIAAPGGARADAGEDDVRAYLASIEFTPARTRDATVRDVREEVPSDLLTASVLICSASDDLAAAQAAVAAEQEAARLRGVADLTRLDENRAAASRAERARTAAWQLLRERRQSPLGCGEPEVARLVRCVHEMDSVSPDAWCDDPTWHALQERLHPD